MAQRGLKATGKDWRAGNRAGKVVDGVMSREKAALRPECGEVEERSECS